MCVVCCTFPTLVMIGPIATVFGVDFERIAGVFPGVYVFYLLLGYYISTHFPLLLSKRKQIYVLGIASMLVMLGIHYAITEESDVAIVFNVPITIMIYILACTLVGGISFRCRKQIRNVADCSFGIYLIHTFIQYGFQISGIEQVLFQLGTVIGIIGYSIALFGVSYISVLLIRKCKVGRAIT